MEKTLQMEKSKFLSLDLQYFSEESHPFAEEPAPVEPHPFAESPDESMFANFAEQKNPLLAPDNPVPPTQVQQTVEQPEGQGLKVDQENPEEQQQEQFLDFSGRKVPVIDPVINDLHRDYTNLNKTYQTTNQENQQLRQLNEQYQQMMAQQQPVQPEVPQVQAGPSQERIAELNQEYMERLYENKFEADQWWQNQPEVQQFESQRLESVVSQRVNEIVGPIQQERELQTQVQQLRDKFADFETVTPAIQELIAQQPHLAELPNALETMYYMAKGRATENTPAVPTPEEMLQNPQFQEQIVQNEQIRNMIMQNYQQQKLQQTQQIPTVIGSNAGAQTPMSAGESKPKSLAEASAHSVVIWDNNK